MANVEAVQSAATYYSTRNVGAPPAGRAWATSSANGGPYLQSWPIAPGDYTIAWNGRAVVVTPAHGRASVGSAGTTAPPSGCDDL